MSSIFLSHNSKDKIFVRKLANDLRRKGYYVWVDEAEIKLGDSLIEKIREGIDKVQYIGVVLSENSIKSEWVKREVDIAINQEIAEKKVKVLPLMLEQVDLPGFLVGKLYADFTCEDRYSQGMNLIMERLDEVPSEVDERTFTAEQARVIQESLGQLRKQLDVTRREKRLVLERLSIERSVVPKSLLSAIDHEKRIYPELDDVNRNFAFVCGDFNVTVGYVLHGIRKETIKGGPHQIALLCDIHNKNNELSLLVESIGRRLNSISDSSFFNNI
ncbi:toll/interleukin-1 receptor domain-containing protein [Oceanobacillus massiliensis]|uniref:toll/interleukin-1 receptor domain-containing protein n=1 Tax=Oceanobacillus massiliensis TaxID=1465765 RepID=UPI00301AF565